MPTKKIITPLLPGNYYHIFNRGNDHVRIFYSKENYRYFLNKYFLLLEDHIDTYCYCLLPNHFHLLVRVKESNDEKFHLKVSHQFRRLFQSYALSINKQEGRDGSLFRKYFRRIHIRDMNYLRRLVFYIHFNPQKHQLIQNFRYYPHSSYNLVINQSGENIRSTDVISWFNDVEDFILYHNCLHDERKVKEISLEDD